MSYTSTIKINSTKSSIQILNLILVLNISFLLSTTQLCYSEVDNLDNNQIKISDHNKTNNLKSDSKWVALKRFIDNYHNIIDISVNILGILIASLVIIFQIKKGFKDGLELQNQNFRDNLGLDIYKSILAILTATNTQITKTDTFLLFIPSNIRQYQSNLTNPIYTSLNMTPPVIRQRTQDFINKHSEISDCMIKLVTITEQYEIVSKNFKIYNFAFQSCNYDLTNKFKKLTPILSKYLPVDVDINGNTQTGNIKILNENELCELDTAIQDYRKNLFDILGYTYDLRIELQNLFLGELFNNKLDRRAPQDKDKLVIYIDNEDTYQQLYNHFTNDTDWGKELARYRQQNINKN